MYEIVRYTYTVYDSVERSHVYDYERGQERDGARMSVLLGRLKMYFYRHPSTNINVRHANALPHLETRRFFRLHGYYVGISSRNDRKNVYISRTKCMREKNYAF